jgi:hypothetical protein
MVSSGALSDGWFAAVPLGIAGSDVSVAVPAPFVLSPEGFVAFAGFAGLLGVLVSSAGPSGISPVSVLPSPTPMVLATPSSVDAAPQATIKMATSVLGINDRVRLMGNSSG